MKHQAAAKAQIHKTEGVILGMLNTLEKLAAHPDNFNAKAPHFVSLNTSIRPAADYDGMMGSLILEQGLGTLFNDAAGSSLDVATVMDCASEYLSDRAKDAPERDLGRGKGTFALGEHKTICNDFSTCQREGALEAFYADCDERLDIEEALQALDQKLSLYQRLYQSAEPVLTLQ